MNRRLAGYNHEWDRVWGYQYPIALNFMRSTTNPNLTITPEMEKAIAIQTRNVYTPNNVGLPMSDLIIKAMTDILHEDYINKLQDYYMSGAQEEEGFFWSKKQKAKREAKRDAREAAGKPRSLGAAIVGFLKKIGQLPAKGLVSGALVVLQPLEGTMVKALNKKGIDAKKSDKLKDNVGKFLEYVVKPIRPDLVPKGAVDVLLNTPDNAEGFESFTIPQINPMNNRGNTGIYVPPISGRTNLPDFTPPVTSGANQEGLEPTSIALILKTVIAAITNFLRFLKQKKADGKELSDLEQTIISGEETVNRELEAYKQEEINRQVGGFARGNILLILLLAAGVAYVLRK